MTSFEARGAVTSRRAHSGYRGSPCASSGFTYVGLLFTLAIMGAIVAQAQSLWSIAAQRDRETELLSIGYEFRQAIRDYYENTPGMVKRYPEKLDDLLVDNRYAATVRHLRRVYRDPITGQTEWGLMQARDGGIMGIYSLSTGSTLKRSQFARVDQEFEGKSRYSDWRFAYAPVGSR